MRNAAVERQTSFGVFPLVRADRHDDEVPELQFRDVGGQGRSVVVVAAPVRHRQNTCIWMPRPSASAAEADEFGETKEDVLMEGYLLGRCPGFLVRFAGSTVCTAGGCRFRA